MACNSIVALSRNCGDSLAGGITELYMMAFKDSAKLVGSTEIYAVDSLTKMVDEVGRTEDSKFVKIDISPNMANGLALALTKDNSVGTFYFTQTLTLILSGLTQEIIDFIQNVGNQPVVAILKARNGKYYIIGLVGDLEVTTTEGGTGDSLDAGQNQTLTFVGSANTYVYIFDPTALPDLLTPYAP